MNPNSVLSQSQKPSLPPAHIIQALRPLRSSGVRNGSVRMAGGGRGVGPVRSSSWYTGVCSVSTRLAGCPSAATVVIAPGVTTTWSIPGKYSPGLGGNHLAAASSGVSGVQPRAMSSGRLHRALTIASSSLGGSGAVAQPGVSVARRAATPVARRGIPDAGANRRGRLVTHGVPLRLWVRRHNAPNRPNRTARTLPYEPAITSNAFSLIM